MPDESLARTLTAVFTLIIGPLSAAQEGVSDLGGAAPATADTALHGPESRPSLWWGDLDRDGREDVYAVLPDGSGRMLMNRGGGRFEDVTALVGLAGVSGARMAAWTDVDGDGREDLFVVSRAGAQLFVQAAGGVLVDESAARGLALDDQVVEARFRDLDGDGRAELALTTSTEERLYLNDGRGCFVALDLGLPPVAPAVGAPPMLGAPPAAAPEAARGREQPSAQRAVPAGGVAPGLGTPGSSGAAFASPDQASFAAFCVDRVRDQANPTSCLVASTIPGLGELYPITSDLFVEAGTGRVGINTTTPSALFDVNGPSRFDGQARFESQIVSNLSAGAPFLVSSVDRVVNLNADLLDGLHAGDFATLPIDSGGILDGAIVDADVSPSAAIQGAKVAPDFGDQDVVTDGALRVGPYVPPGTNPFRLVVSAPPSSDGLDATRVFVHNDGNQDGSYQALSVSVRDEPINSVSIGAGLGSLVLDAGDDITVRAHGELFLVSETHPVRVLGDLALEGPLQGALSGGPIVVTHSVQAQQDLQVNGTLDVDGALTASGDLDVQGALHDSTGSLTIADQLTAWSASIGDGALSDWEVRGLSALPSSNGYLAVQGTNDFDGVTTLDWPNWDIGVLGVSAGGTAIDNIGVLGHSNLKGVRGEYSGAPQRDWGELGTSGYGVVGSGATAGVRGQATASLGGLDGVLGETDVGAGYGVFGWHKGTSGAARGVVGQTSASGGDAVTAYGDFAGTGAKYFVQPHPTDPTKEVRMVCLEGNESGTYFRGTAFTLDGRAEIEVPEAFRLTTAPEGLTVQVTAVGAPARIWVESKGLERIVVRSDFDVELDYFVNGVRRGYEDLGERLVRENRSFLPTEMGVPFGTQYPDGVRRMLVENGLLNADYTPNEMTIAVLEAQLQEYRARHGRLAEQRALDAVETTAGVEEEDGERGRDD